MRARRLKLCLALAIAGCLVGGITLSPLGGARATGPVVGYPNSIASLGDSITRAMDADGTFGDQPENSWSTGTSPSVDSIYSRLLVVNPAISGNRFNDAVSGATMADLNGQAQTAVAQGSQLVLILMGANDICTSSEATMTPVATFRSEFQAAMQTISIGLPDARIAVISIPDVYNLWSILHDNASARFVWAFASICQSLLGNPTSTDAADVQRRADVRQRNIDDNTALHDVCAEYVHCLFDNYLGFNTSFTPTDVSTLDYFHPSVIGQALIASLAWGNSYDFSDLTAPVSDSTGSAVAGGVSVQLTATDNDGVSGIEYNTAADAYQRYTAPVTVATGSTLTWRAVDVNGNVEASHTCRIDGLAWPPGDSDCDGFTTTLESAMGTLNDSGCAATPAVDDEPVSGPNIGPDAWPMDFNDDQKANLSDVLKYGPVFNSSGPNPPYNRRYDLNADNQINLSDILTFSPFFNRSCS